MNRHIKIINGRKYYYSSIRRGRKVTSKYLGPVERLRKKKSTFQEIIEQTVPQMAEQPQGQPETQEEHQSDDENYIG